MKNGIEEKITKVKKLLEGKKITVELNLNEALTIKSYLINDIVQLEKIFNNRTEEIKELKELLNKFEK